MKDNMVRKGMVYAIVVLFIGVSVIPLTGSKSVDKTPVSDDSMLNCNCNGCHPVFNGTMGKNGWYVSYVKVTFEGSECGNVWYRLDGGHYKFYTGPFTIGGDGIHMFYWFYIDSSGNVVPGGPIKIKIDQTPPTTTAEFDGIIEDEGWFVSNVTVTLSAEDETSGVDYTLYKIDDGEWTTYTVPFVVTEDGEHTLYCYSVDLAGNVEDIHQVTFKIEKDNEPPVTTHAFSGIMGDNDWYVSDVTVALTATDNAAGVDSTMYKIDDDIWKNYTGPFLVRDDGEYSIEYYSVDKVGNIEPVKGPFEFKIDQTFPTIELTWDEENLKLIADVYDETSGVAKVEFYVNDEFVGEVTEPPWQWYYPEASSGDTAQAIAYDFAGNSAVSEGPPSFYFSMIGIICNREIIDENISFFAIIVRTRFPHGWKIFEQVTMPNDYEGRIGLFFINADWK